MLIFVSLLILCYDILNALGILNLFYDGFLKNPWFFIPVVFHIIFIWFSKGMLFGTSNTRDTGYRINDIKVYKEDRIEGSFSWSGLLLLLTNIIGIIVLIGQWLL